jgi:hypothetical protein
VYKQNLLRDLSTDLIHFCALLVFLLCMCSLILKSHPRTFHHIGSSKQIDVNKLKDNMPYVLVATPGKLIDHMKSTHVNGVPFSEIISNVSVWVLDEADRCLDMVRSLSLLPLLHSDCALCSF